MNKQEYVETSGSSGTVHKRTVSVVVLCAAFLCGCTWSLLEAQGASAQTIERSKAVIFELTKPLEVKPNFNWYYHGTRREDGAHQAMWEPLFVLDYATGKLEGWQAEGIEHNDKMDEWTLTLRDGVTWSDGEKFDADDVIYTVEMVLREEDLAAYEAAEMRRALKPNTKLSNGKIVVNGIKKKDDLTVAFKLRKPDPRFALKNFGGEMFGSFLIMPEHIWNGRKAADFVWEKPIGTGPYALESYATDKVIWKRNPNWWGAKTGFQDQPVPTQLIWRFVKDENESAALLAAGELDAAREYSKSVFDKLHGKDPAIIGWSTTMKAGDLAVPAPVLVVPPINENLAWPEPCTRQLEINTQAAPWNDTRLRRALSLMIDRTDLAKKGYSDTTTPSKTMFVEYGAMKPYIDAVVARDMALPPNANIAEAAKFLTEAGYEKQDNLYYNDKNKDKDKDDDEEVLSAIITVNGSVAKDKVATENLRDQLLAAGFDARLKIVSNDEYWGRDIPTGNYALAYGWLSCGSIAEPYTSMARYRMTNVPPIDKYSRGFNNTGRWDTEVNKKYALILDKIQALPLDDVDIPELVADAYVYLQEETPFIPLVQTPRIIPFNTKYWTGWPSSTTYGVPMHTWGSAHMMIHALTASPVKAVAKPK